MDDTGKWMQATEIEPVDDLSSVGADEYELEGLVTIFVSAVDFSVGNQAVQTNDQTLFVGGRPEDVKEGIRLEVGGVMAGDILVAGEVEFWNPHRVSVEGVVNKMISIYEFSVGRQRVQSDEDTAFENGGPEHIVPGTAIDVEGVIINGILYADKIDFGEA